MSKDRSKADRRIEKTIEIRATPEQVWRAISDPEELIRWFPAQARVEPGEGGSIWISWGPGAEGKAPITAWEEGKRLQWTEEYPAAEGQRPVRLAVDFRIEARGGHAIVRFVQSGFGPEADWDDTFDGLDEGWGYFLHNLKHYLEHHAGTPRDLISVRRRGGAPREQAWERLLNGASEGMIEWSPGAQSYQLRLGGGRYSGKLIRANPPFNFAGTLDSLNDGILFIELERGGSDWQCGIWLSTYGLPSDRVGELRQALESWAQRFFPQA